MSAIDLAKKIAAKIPSDVINHSGYEIRVDPNATYFRKPAIKVTAHHPEQGQVGEAYLSNKGTHLSPQEIEVDELHRRQGLASKMYDAAEKRSGLEVTPTASDMSDDAKAFWKNRLQLGVAGLAAAGAISFGGQNEAEAAPKSKIVSGALQKLEALLPHTGNVAVDDAARAALRKSPDKYEQYLKTLDESYGSQSERAKGLGLKNSDEVLAHMKSVDPYDGGEFLHPIIQDGGYYRNEKVPLSKIRNSVEKEAPDKPMVGKNYGESDEDIAKEYSKKTTSAPSIILNKDFETIDGAHRSRAAHLRGATEIDALIPNRSNDAAFDPRFKNSADLLAGKGAVIGGGNGAAGNYEETNGFPASEWNKSALAQPDDSWNWKDYINAALGHNKNLPDDINQANTQERADELGNAGLSGGINSVGKVLGPSMVSKIVSRMKPQFGNVIMKDAQPVAQQFGKVSSPQLAQEPRIGKNNAPQEPQFGDTSVKPTMQELIEQRTRVEQFHRAQQIMQQRQLQSEATASAQAESAQARQAAQQRMADSAQEQENLLTLQSVQVQPGSTH